MDSLQRSWPFLGTKCSLCFHQTCRACREISVSNLACCRCRARVIERLDDFDKIHNSEDSRPEVRQF